ncbi:hypothetical protein [Microbispora sp. H10830]|nr:hypothetical protein [Microbispora sp. H10830]
MNAGFDYPEPPGSVRPLERTGAFRVYADPADLLTRLDEVGVRVRS